MPCPECGKTISVPVPAAPPPSLPEQKNLKWVAFYSFVFSGVVLLFDYRPLMTLSREPLDSMFIIPAYALAGSFLWVGSKVGYIFICIGVGVCAYVMVMQGFSPISMAGVAVSLYFLFEVRKLRGLLK
jgi:hypothetical protein